MSHRKPVSLKMNTNDLVVLLSEGNPGAVTVLMEMMSKDFHKCIIWYLDLDDMNMRGEQIWLGYKDFSGSDIDEFINNIETRNEDMIMLINERSSTNEVAVPRGASYTR